jgi:hypothetical protein
LLRPEDGEEEDGGGRMGGVRWGGRGSSDSSTLSKAFPTFFFI